MLQGSMLLAHTCKCQIICLFLRNLYHLIPMSSHQRQKSAVGVATNALSQAPSTTQTHWKVFIPLTNKACSNKKQRR